MSTQNNGVFHCDMRQLEYSVVGIQMRSLDLNVLNEDLSTKQNLEINDEKSPMKPNIKKTMCLKY